MLDVRFELIRTLRMPSFLVPILFMPPILYLLIGILYTHNMKFPAGAALSEQRVLADMFVNFSVYGMIGPGMLAFGAALATERDKGLLTLKRALPIPGIAYVLPKMCMAVIYAAVVLVMQIVLATTVGHLRATPLQLVAFGFGMLPGVLPFSAIGLYIGSRLSSVAASAYVNVLYIGMTILGGLFFQLPGLAGYGRLFSPAHYLAEVGRAAIALPTTTGPWLSAIVLASLTLTLSVMAARALRRPH
jgi:ABC-2 type transport system permease protein